MHRFGIDLSKKNLNLDNEKYILWTLFDFFLQTQWRFFMFNRMFNKYLEQCVKQELEQDCKYFVVFVTYYCMSGNRRCTLTYFSRFHKIFVKINMLLITQHCGTDWVAKTKGRAERFLTKQNKVVKWNSWFDRIFGFTHLLL